MNKFSAIASLIAASAFASPAQVPARRNASDPHSAAAKAVRSASQK